MKKSVIEVYQLPSMTKIIGSEDGLVLVDLAGKSVVVGGPLDDALSHLRRQNACGVFMAMSMMGGPTDERTPAERLSNVLASQETPKPAGEGVCLVTRCSREFDDQEVEHLVDLGELSISLDREIGGSFADDVRELRSAALTALTVAGPDGVTHDAKLIGAASYLTRDGASHLIYLVYPSVSTTMTSQCALLPEQASLARTLVGALMSAPKNLRHVPRLLAQANETRLHPVTSFIAAWAGLEILVSATFSQYEKAWYKLLSGSIPDGSEPVVKRMSEVMKDKFRIADKFSVISSQLGGDEAPGDVSSFIGVKAVRDSFFHSVEASPEALPADQARRLLKKYLLLHLSRTTSEANSDVAE